jgi:hypothetical protein
MLVLVAATDIADRVHMRGHAGLPHPGEDQVGGDAMLLFEKDAGDVGFVFRNRGERSARRSRVPAADFQA